MYNWHPKNAEVDPDAPIAWGTCDRCGMIWNVNKLTWQYSYNGSTSPQNTRFLVCPKHIDPLNPQDMPFILAPDPLPIYNARPFPYALDEASWLLTQDLEVITTQGGEYIGTAIPNPQDNAATAYLSTVIDAGGQMLPPLYLDIFDGNPSSRGRSVLEQITGSSARIYIDEDLTTTAGTALNTDLIIIAAASGATVNSNWIGLYSEAGSGGVLLFSGECDVRWQSVTVGNPVVFAALDLQIINVAADLDTLMQTEGGEPMITQNDQFMALE